MNRISHNLLPFVKRSAVVLGLPLLIGASYDALAATPKVDETIAADRAPTVVDVELVQRIWAREFAGDVTKLHNEGVEELLAIIASLSINRGRLYNESGLAFNKGRLLVALSKLDIKNELDRMAYRLLLEIDLFGVRSNFMLAETESRSGDLEIVGKSTVSYIAKRLFLLSKIGNGLKTRYYGLDWDSERRRKAEPDPNDPANGVLLMDATSAAALFRQTKARFQDETLKSAIQLALASLKRDGVSFDLDLAIEFHPLQVSLDALNDTLKDNIPNLFWFSLRNELRVREIETQDCLFLPATNDEIKRRLEFLREDLELCRTNQAPSGANDPGNMTLEEFKKLIKSKRLTDETKRQE